MHRIVTGALTLIVIIGVQALTGADASHAVRTLTTQFTYKAGVADIPVGAKVLNLWIPIPSDGKFQTIRDLRVEAPVTHRITRETKFGNRMVFVRIENPSGPVSATVRFTVDRKEVAVLDGSTFKIPARAGDSLDRYLQPDNRVPVGGRFETMALEAVNGKPTNLEKARAIYEHTVQNMQYDYKKESPKYAQGDVAFVCDYKKGNCSDLHSYIISLARSLGIPAYLEYGFPLNGIPVPSPLPRKGVIGGYHCWTWIYDPQHGWVPLDASDGRRWLDSNRPDVKEKLFGNLVLERSAVAFSRGRDITLVPPQKAGSLNDFIYPYAEADGEPVNATYEVRYALPAASFPQPDILSPSPTNPTNQDLQRQIDELRKMVTDQAQEIARLKGQKPAVADNSPHPVTTASREQVGFYGFLRLDSMWDSEQPSNSQIPFFVQSPSNANVGGRGNTTMSMHPRLSRLGWSLAAPPQLLKATNVTGKFEIDFANGYGLTPESRPLPRIRHAYLQLQRGANNLLFGQTWDLISPLFPSPNEDTLMWNAGNLGDRRAQVRYTNETPSRPFSAAIALGLTGAIDAKDLDANAVRDGEDSGAPNVQARLGWKVKSTNIGLWGHYAWEGLTKPVVGRRQFTSDSLGLDLTQKLGSKMDLRGELWLGQNLSDFRGGIGQGVNVAAGSEIRSHGGWIELGLQTTPVHRIAMGYTEDNPVDADIPAGGRLKNYSIFLHNRWKVHGNIEVGANYLYWLTSWKGLASGIDHRFNAFVQHNF